MFSLTLCLVNDVIVFHIPLALLPGCDSPEILSPRSMLVVPLCDKNVKRKSAVEER